MIGQFDEFDDWNEVTASTAVPLSCLQMLWEKDKVYTQNHFSRDYVVIYCLVQQVKVESYKYTMTAFAPKLWLNTSDSSTASSDEFQTYRFNLVDNADNVARANKLQTWTPIFVKCKLDRFCSKETVAFDKAEVLIDYKTPIDDLTLLPYVKNKILNTKNIDSFIKLVSTFTGWSKEECVALYFNINKLGQDISTSALNIENTIKQRGEEVAAMTQNNQSSKSKDLSVKDIVEFIAGVIIVILIFKACVSG